MKLEELLQIFVSLCESARANGESSFLQNSGNHSAHKSNYLYLFTYLGFTIWVISLIYCFKYITVYVKYYLYKFCCF